MNHTYPGVAIVGTACQLPSGVDDIHKLVDFCAARRCATKPIPSKRWRTEDYYHPDSTKPGHYHVLGGSFLERDIAAFDAPFFGIGEAEAQAMDPQERIMLETAYLALENAGITLQDLRGRTDVAVFSGGSRSEYDIRLSQDRATMPRYTASGNAMCMFSNRISYFFDIHGASVTIDTACSSGLTALDLAVEHIRSGRCKVAIVGGTFVQISPTGVIGMGVLGTLAKSGKSLAFDASAEGYGRGDGSACIVLASQEYAQEAGYVPRALIRATDVNHSGRTQGITMPGGESQVDLIRTVYERAQLDPCQTAYVEAHGTGTERGDEVETRSIAEAFGVKQRHLQRPLYVGTAKSNFGHCEGASGIVSVIKSVAMLESRLILPTANFTQPSATLAIYASRMVVPTQVLSWPEDAPLRISVSNFGFGGSNAHVILDGIPTLPTDRTPDQSNDQTKLFLFSGRDEQTLKAQLSSHAEALGRRVSKPKDSIYLGDLAYTLSERRTRFDWQHAMVASDVRELQNALGCPAQIKRRQDTSAFVFVFTGQGSAWAGMGVSLMHITAFAQSMLQADEVLRSLGASWSIIDEISHPESTSKIKSAALSQPAITAIQIALIAMLREVGIQPSKVIGHSSGEIAAAFACGALNLDACMAVAYYRGAVVSLGDISSINTADAPGAMLAVGSAAEDIEPLLESLFDGVAGIACYNSPNSVTVSGDRPAILELKDLLDVRGTFNRLLEVDQAYHSGHMFPLVDKYLSLIEPCLAGLEDSKTDVRFISSVTGRQLETRHLRLPWYWATNLASPVRFAAGVSTLLDSCIPESAQNVAFLEIGPHKALANPVQAMLKASQCASRALYHATMQRGVNGHDNFLRLVADLICQGCKVDATKAVRMTQEKHHGRLLTDLPPYRFNLSRRHWHASPFADGPESLTSKWNVLLGHRQPHIPGTIMHFRNPFTLEEIPWLKDHVVNDTIVFPLAGYLCAVLEALAILVHDQGLSARAFVFKEIAIGNAFILSTKARQELLTTLLPGNSSSAETSSRDTIRFTTTSWTSAGGFVEHCKGSVTIMLQEDHDTVSSSRHEVAVHKHLKNLRDSITGSVNIRDFYKATRNCGLQYGPYFQGLSSLLISSVATTGTVRVSDTSKEMPAGYENELKLHPTTLDSAFHAGLCHLAGNDGNLTALRAHMPISIARLYIAADLRHEASAVFDVCTHGSKVLPGTRKTEQNLVLCLLNSDQVVLEVNGMVSIDVHEDSVLPQIAEVMNLQKILWQIHPFLSQLDTLGSELSIEDSDRISMLENASLYYLGKATRLERSSTAPTHITLMRQWMANIISERPEVRLLPTGFEKLCETNVDAEMIRYAGEGLESVLCHQQEPLEVLTQNSCLSRYYEECTTFQESRRTMIRFVQQVAAQNPALRILEIGAGTAGFTSGLLEALTTDKTSSNFCHYTFTDLSTAFFPEARTKLEKWASKMSFTKLDICADPSSQGLTFSSYDLVIGALVVHATPDMTTSMQNIWKLLRPHGHMLLIEMSSFRPLLFPFGLLPGWWAQGGQGPCRTRDQWESQVQATGFSGLGGYWEDGLCCCVFWAQVDQNRASGSSHIRIISSDDEASSLGHDIKAALWRTRKTSQVISLQKPHQAVGPSDIVICLADESQLNLLTADPDHFEAIKDMLVAAEKVLWVATGAAKEHESSLDSFALGFGRVLRVEASGKRFVTFQADPLAAEHTAACIAKVVSHALLRDAGLGDIDSEYRQSGPNLLFSRVVADEGLAEALQEITKTDRMVDADLTDDCIHVKATCARPGQVSSVSFESFGPVKQNPALAPDEVLISIKAAGLNFKDLLIVLGRVPFEGLGKECAGIVMAAGSDACKRYRTGDRVVHWGDGLIASTARCHETTLAHIPLNLSFEEAASSPVVFATAYECLVNAAGVQPGERVLIHAASGGVGQAAIILCQWLGAEIYCTVSSQEKKDVLMAHYGISSEHIFSSRSPEFAQHLMTLIDGIDVVINSLAGEMVRATWECMAPFGCFIDIGKRDALANNSLSMRPFAKGASYKAVDLSLIIQHKPQAAQNLLQTVMKLMGDGTIRPVTPITTMPMASIQDSLRLMQAGKHIGKVVLTNTDSTPAQALQRYLPPALFDPVGTYVITGGTGGLGRAMVSWMLERGAKRILLLSRSGEKAMRDPRWSAVQTKAATCLADIVARQCDVSQLAEVQSCLSVPAVGSHPIKGVIHGAMVLKDSLYESATPSDWSAVIAPKVHGAFNLHTVTTALPNALDFFICLSSAATLGLTLGQTSYAGANSVLDALCHWRGTQNLPAASLAFPAIEDAGYVAENRNALTAAVGGGAGLQDWSDRSIKMEDLLKVLEVAVLNPGGAFSPTDNGNHTIIGLRPTAATMELLPHNELLFSHFRHRAASTHGPGNPTTTTTSSKTPSLSNLLSSTTDPTPTQIHTIITGALTNKIADMLSLPPSEIRADTCVSDLGIDSLVAVELRNWLATEAKAQIPVLDIIGATSISALAEVVAGRCRMIEGRKKEGVA